MTATPKPIYSKDRFLYVRRIIDGQQLDMSEYDWFENMTEDNRKGFVFLHYVEEQVSTFRPPTPTMATPGDDNMFACPICGKTYTQEIGLAKHKKSHA